MIVDPDDLWFGKEICIDPKARTIKLNIVGKLSADGVTLQAVYSFFMSAWKEEEELIYEPFPMIAYSTTMFELCEGWKFADNETTRLLRKGSWKDVDDSVWTSMMELPIEKPEPPKKKSGGFEFL